MWNHLRPLRGKKLTAIDKLKDVSKLLSGEIFFEVSDNGIGYGEGNIKMGDGVSDYDKLSYFMTNISDDNCKCKFTNVTSPTSTPFQNTNYLANIKPENNIKIIFNNIKQLLLNYNTAINSLNTNERKFVFVMDSFGGHVLEYIISGMELDNNHVWSVWNGGSGFNTSGSQFPNFTTMLQGLVVPNPDTITDVVVIGGINDGGSVFTPEDARAGFDAFYDYSHNRFPNAKIWWGCNGVITTASSDGNFKRAQELRAYSGMYSSTKPYVYMRGIEWCLLDNNNKESDCVHTNVNGSKVFAAKIISCLNGGSADYLTSAVDTATLTPYSCTIQGNIQIYRENNAVKGNLRTLSVTNINLQLGDGNNIKIAKMDSRLLRGGFFNSYGSHLDLGTTYATFTDTNDTVRRGLVTLTLDMDNNLYLELREPLYNLQSNIIKQIFIQYMNFEVSGMQN